METREETKRRYWAALDKLTTKLETDYYVLATVLYGSLARGDPWEKSDIDLMIIVRDDPQNRAPSLAFLTEDGITIDAQVFQRNAFKRALEGALQGSILHSVRSQCKLLFTKDDSIAAWLEESVQIGARDQPFQLLRTASGVFWLVDKARKWLYAKRDLHYSFLWVMRAVNALASVEVVLNGEAPSREALDRALVFNPDFFNAVYVDLINGPKTEETIESALKAIDDYLERRAERIFAPVFDYLAEGDSPRTITDLSTHLRKKTQTDGFHLGYEWLADHSFIEKLSSPLRLTRKSRVTVEEPAFYYDSGPGDWE